MAYSSISGRLPNEKASKLGHLDLVKSEWIKSLIDNFESRNIDENNEKFEIGWKSYSSKSIPLSRIWSVDGSNVVINVGQHPKKEVAFIKTALFLVNMSKLEDIDKSNPHPLHMKALMSDSALFHSTIFPLNNVKTNIGNNYDTIRHIIFDSIKFDKDGIYYDTFKWLLYKKWENNENNTSPEFSCPHCGNIVNNGFHYNRDVMSCINCKEEILLTDVMGFHLDMLEDNAPENIVSAYMIFLETMMLFTPIRKLWHFTDKSQVSNFLFIKDGPLSFSSQYSKLVPNIREFFNFTKIHKRPVHVIGCEKSGKFFNHLMSIEKFISPKKRGDKMTYFVLSHKYIIDEVQRRPKTNNQYGSRTNWGEKVYVKTDPGNFMVLNIPSGLYNDSDEYPREEDLIGLERILKTIPSIISSKYEGALFPVELANGVASLSSYPSSKILERFVESNL